MLAFYITLSTCLTTLFWLMMVGRFVSCRLESYHTLTPTTPSDFDSERNPITVLCHHEIDGNNNKTKRLENHILSAAPMEDRFLILLNLQLDGISSVIVCKWPIILTSCFFVTLLSWDLVGDEVGWREALWVPVAGAMILVIVWIWDQFLVSHLVNLANSHSTIVSRLSSPHDPPLTSLSVPTPHSVELVC